MATVEIYPDGISVAYLTEDDRNNIVESLEAQAECVHETENDPAMVYSNDPTEKHWRRECMYWRQQLQHLVRRFDPNRKEFPVSLTKRYYVPPTHPIRSVTS
jgi:hypothetical protein